MTEQRRYLVRNGEQTTPVDTLPDGRFRVEGADEPFTVTPEGGGACLVSDGTRSWRVFVAGPPDARHVFARGAVARLEVAPDVPGRRRARADHGEATSAPMPATVTAILVAAGQTVSQGDILLKLEAMKMEMPLRAPKDGTVAALHCRVGELVQPGVPLVEIA